MTLHRVRFTIGQLMIAVAAVAVLLVWRDVRVAFALVGLGLVVVIPAAIAPPARRLEAASWASSLQPAVILSYLYLTWVTAWCVLGHCPRPALDDPNRISPVVDVPYVMFAFSASYGWGICACTGFLLAATCCVRRSNPRPLVALPFAWLAGYIALMFDPLGVFFWYAD
jgi:hypothetical protein